MHVFYGVRVDIGHQADPQQLGERVRDDAADHDRSNAPQRRVFLHYSRQHCIRPSNDNRSQPGATRSTPRHATHCKVLPLGDRFEMGRFLRHSVVLRFMILRCYGYVMKA